LIDRRNLMTTDTPSRRLSVAITAAAASTTLAIAATAASLLGWIRPAPEAAPDPSPTTPGAAPAPAVIFVPITPATPRAVETAPAQAPLDLPDPGADERDDDDTADEPRLAYRDHHHDREDDDGEDD
jgi:hypothetical protein